MEMGKYHRAEPHDLKQSRPRTIISLTEWLCRTLPVLHRPVLVDGKIGGNGFDVTYQRNPCISSQRLLLHCWRLRFKQRSHEKARGVSVFFRELLADVPREANTLHEDVFGPVALVVSFDSEEEAVAAANATAYGLVACVYTGSPCPGSCDGRIPRM